MKYHLGSISVVARPLHTRDTVPIYKTNMQRKFTMNKERPEGRSMLLPSPIGERQVDKLKSGMWHVVYN